MTLPNGVLDWKLETGGQQRVICLCPLMFGAAKITRAERPPWRQHPDLEHEFSVVGYDEEWMYPAIANAISAYATWDGAGEPEGWYRHKPSDRRRPEFLLPTGH